MGELIDWQLAFLEGWDGVALSALRIEIESDTFRKEISRQVEVLNCAT
jgi:hypothetical protein